MILCCFYWYLIIFVIYFDIQKLQGSLEVAYGRINEAENSEVFEEFFEWKNARLEKFSRVRNATDTSLQNLELSLSKIIQVKNICIIY